MVIKYLDYSECTLCQACVNICPKECIKLKFFKDGFEYPTINEEECIGCEKCKNVCPVLEKLNEKESLKKVFIAKNLNESIREKSSSGGIFTEIAEKIFEQNGSVSGAVFDENFKVRHIMIKNRKELHKLRGSKYVQSNIGNVYNLIKQELNIGTNVLFTGCPCQIAGLNKFLGKEYKNLYTMDFICHGIPGQYTFDKYIEYLEKKYNSKIQQFSFRDKSNGWHTFSIKAVMSNGKEYCKRAIDDTYMRGYFKNISLKQACYNCKFRNLTSGSDITLGDFWGAEVEEKEIDDDKGLSLIIINSLKGENIIHSLKGIFIKEINFDTIVKYNQGILYSFKENIHRNDFFCTVKNNGYDKAFDKYCKQTKVEKLKNIIRRNLSKVKQSIIRIC